MTDPPKNRHGFAGPTAPPAREFDPSSVTDWINVLHHAAQVPAGHADYAEARAAMEEALGQIGHLNRAANQADRNAADKGPTGIVASTVAPFAHGASLGIGEPLAGAASALTGGTFGEGAQAYREGLDRLEASHPTAAATAELAGLVAPAAAPLRAATGAIEAGRALTFGQGAARVARGAATGGAIGATSGFAAGGEDPGSIPQRVDAAQRGGVAGAVVGGVLTGGAMMVGRRHAERMADLEARGSQRRAVALREELLRQRVAANLKAPAPAVPGAAPIGTAEEQAVAKALGIPVEQVRGRVGQAAVDRAAVRGPAPGPVPASPPVAAAAPPSVAAPQAAESPAIRSRPEMTVPAPAGPYQLAAPATRMQSMPANVTNEAIRLSGRHPELLEPIPTDVLQMHHDLGQAFGTGDPAALRAVAMELARRLRGAVGRGLSAQ